MKYRKTALIEAEQYQPGMEDGIDEKGPYLDTLEGKLYIPPNGWIATGVNGERWAIQDDIFRMTYEAVDE
jgi:hypothetical protein